MVLPAAARGVTMTALAFAFAPHHAPSIDPGYIVFGVLGVFGAAFLAVIVFIVIAIVRAPAAIAKADRAQEAKWAPYAAARGLRVLPGSGSLFNHVPVRISGLAGGVTVTIDTYVETSGGSTGATTMGPGGAPIVNHTDSKSTTYTRVKAEALAPIAVSSRIYREHLFSGLGKLLGVQDVQIGYPAFDEAFVVKADDEARVRMLLREAPCRALLAFPKSFLLEYERGALSFRWEGNEEDPRVLDAAIAVAAAFCGH